ncbi:MAG: SdrD B-like domain-containing protein [Caldilineaceae bacterium]
MFAVVLGLRAWTSASAAPAAPAGESTIGDFVWRDQNANGVQDVGEVGINGVRVELWQDDGDGVFEPAQDTFVEFLLTGDDASTPGIEAGWYQFDVTFGGGQLYWVTIPAGQFAPGAPLANHVFTSGNTIEPNPALVFSPNIIDNIDTIDFGYAPISMAVAKTVYAGHNNGASCPGGELVTGGAGTNVTYCFVVTHTGTAGSLTNVQLDDATLGNIDQTDMVLKSGTLPLLPGQSLVYYYQTTLTQDLTNTVTATGTPSDSQGTTIPDTTPLVDEDTAQVDALTAAITLDKTVYLGDDSGAGCPAAGQELVTADVGQVVTYCFVATNTGQTYLNDVTLLDTSLGIDQTDMTLKSGTEPLAPGATLVYYYVTAIDGSLRNTARASANPTDANGNDVPGLPNPSDTDTAEVNSVTPGIEVRKTVYRGHNNGATCPGGESLLAFVGSQITYCFAVENTGNTYLNALTLNDTTLSITQANMTPRAGNPTLPLAPGGVFYYYYQTTATGSLTNVVTAGGNPVDEQGQDIPNTQNPQDNDTAETVAAQPGIELRKTVYLGHNGGASCPGSETVAGVNGAAVTFCFRVINTGNTYLSSVTVTDTDLGINQANMTLRSGSVPLAPGGTLVYTYDGSIDGDLVNTATATGNPTTSDGTDLPNGQNPTDTDTATVDEVAPAVVIRKTAYAGHDGGASCPGVDLLTGVVTGSAVTYCFVVENTGDTYLNTLLITDNDLSIDQSDMVLKSGTQPLAPGATLVYYYQGTVDGNLVNTAAVTGNPTTPGGTDLPGVPSPSDEDDATIEASGPGIRLRKSAYIGDDGGASCPGLNAVAGAAGAAVTYCFEVTNSGDTYLDNITIADALLGIDDTDMTLANGLTPLAPGDRLLYYYTTVLSADLVNVATAEGDPTDMEGVPIPNAPRQSDDDDATVETVNPGIQVVKTVYNGHDGGASCPGGESVQNGAGGDVTYCFVVTNTGDTYLDDIALADPSLSITEAQMTLLSGATPLAPAASLTYYYEATVDGDLLNTATVTGNPTDATGRDLPNVPNATDDDTATVDEVSADVTLDKSVYRGHDGGASCPGASELEVERGTAVTYCFGVTNSGATRLNPVLIRDDVLGIDQGDMTLLSGATPLAPGASLVYYYETTVQEPIRNVAVVEAIPTDDDGAVIDIIGSVTFTDTVDVVLPPKAAIGDYVWEDLNANGVQEGTEPGLADVTVRLFRTNGQLVAETQSDDDGFYSFTNLDAGDYYVIFVLPDATLFAFSPPNVGGNPNVDSNANQTTGRTGTITLSEGETDNSIDAGIFARCGLRLNKATSAGSVAPGDTMLYVITYANQGARDASNARVVETVPAATTFVPDRSSPGWVCENGGVAGAECTFQLGSIPAGDQGGLDPIVFAVQVDLDLKGVSSITNRALIYDENTVCSSTGQGTAGDGIGGNTDEVTVPAGPTVVVLERFTAKPAGDTIVVAWTTSAEIDTRGFYLYRSVTANRDAAARITPALIPAQGPNGGSYTFTDKYVFEDVSFTYWLVEEELTGRLLEYGPVTTFLGASVNQQRVFLPLLKK